MTYGTFGYNPFLQDPNSPLFRVSDPQPEQAGNNMRPKTPAPPQNFMHQATQFAGGPVDAGKNQNPVQQTPWGDKQNFFGMNNMDAMMLGLGLGGNVWFR